METFLFRLPYGEDGFDKKGFWGIPVEIFGFDGLIEKPIKDGFDSLRIIPQTMSTKGI